MSQKVLFVLASHDTLGDTGKETGFYLSEVSHPVAEFDRAGLTIDYVSPKGGKAPMIGSDRNDLLNAAKNRVTPSHLRIQKGINPQWIFILTLLIFSIKMMQSIRA